MFRRDDILNLQRARPFAPFRVVLSSGESYDIRHPEMILAGNSYLSIGIQERLEQNLPGDTVMVALVHVMRIEPIDQPQPATARKG